MGFPTAAAIKSHLAVAVLVGVPVVAAGFYFWLLQTPTPRVRTPVLIDRSSLLPHRFAGTCENCHRILPEGPVELNLNTMNLVSLTEEEKRLILAGQRVEVPSVMQLLRMPAIYRDDPLPHPYVGVCSNCHMVMNVRPSREYLQEAMRRSYQPLIGMGLPAERIERGGTAEREQRELYRNIFGFIALGLFLAATVYVGMRLLINVDPQRYKRRFRIGKWFTLHEWCSTGFCLAAILHWYFSDRGNNFLHLALVIVVWLTAAGYVLRYRMAEGGAKKSVRLLHSQRFLFYGLIGLLVVGHFFAEWE